MSLRLHSNLLYQKLLKALNWPTRHPRLSRRLCYTNPATRSEYLFGQILEHYSLFKSPYLSYDYFMKFEQAGENPKPEVETSIEGEHVNRFKMCHGNRNRRNWK